MVPQASCEIAALLDLMAALRHPETGCPWDVAQTSDTIARYTIEEAYEVVDAIRSGDRAALRDELGDLLLQVVFHARMAEEDGVFAFGDVVGAITTKLIRRHPHVFDPHVFGPGARRPTIEGVDAIWAEAKRAEREDAGEGDGSVLDGVNAGRPALARAAEIGRRVAAVGFDWPDSGQVADKLREELDEVAEAAAGDDVAAVQDEVGDVLFAAVNLARHHNVDPEAALAGANAKFERRFRAVEARLASEGSKPSAAGLATMERLWVEAKSAERRRR